jgi:hypothetical protein
MPQPPKQDTSYTLFQQLALINRLGLKAYNSKNREGLIFVILNDTVHVVKYDRALLWEFLEDNKPKLLGVSGHVSVAKTSQMIQKWRNLINKIPDPKKPQVLRAHSFGDDLTLWKEADGTEESAILWIPIFAQEKLTLGLWLEIWKIEDKPIPSPENLQLLATFLGPVYGSAWEKFMPKYWLRKMGLNRRKITFGALALLLLLLFIRVPLRVVAPCEVVPNDPYLITAPLDGIIKQIDVKAGQIVKKGAILFEYEKAVPLEELKVAEKEVQIAQAELNRASALGLSDEKSRAEVDVLSLKLQRKKIDLDIAKYRAGKLDSKAPDNGIVMINDPDEWRGKPVKEGEKVMIVSDPSKTKIRIWVPENDNITLDPESMITIFLNTNPAKSYRASLIYIANETTISDEHVPSFVAEANWVDTPPDLKLGLKGSAVLYGERVSLFYFMLRKPWASFRKFLGV